MEIHKKGAVMFHQEILRNSVQYNILLFFWIRFARWSCQAGDRLTMLNAEASRKDRLSEFKN
jgi:hypothetical protein